ncbi:hypothetical protein JCM10450v2_003089 [Rhodotorula kratochvilovae]
MDPHSIKLRYTLDGATTIRRASFPREPTFAALADIARDRFQLKPEQEVELLYRDSDGDLITVSSDQELREYFETLQYGVRAHTFEFRVKAQPAESGATTPLTASEAADDWVLEGGVDAREGEATKDDSAASSTVLFEAVEVSDAASDPEETPLAPAAPASIVERTQALIDAEFPTGAAACDPLDEPLPQATSAPEMPFTGLPSSFASLLSGLPSHAGSFSAHLSSLLTSPQSALGRLSTLATNPVGALDLSDLGASVAQLGEHFSDAAREVVEGVRKEADAVRGEFEQFKLEVEREKARFEDEVRRALEQAAQTPSPFAPRSNAPEPSEMGTTAADEDDESESAAEDVDPEEPALRLGAGAPASLAELERRRAAVHAKRAAKEARRIAREKRRQEKEARREERREARKAEKAARRASRAAAASAGPVEKAAAPIEQTAAPAAEKAAAPVEEVREESAEAEMSTMPGGLPVSPPLPPTAVQTEETTWGSRYAPAYLQAPAAGASAPTSHSTAEASPAHHDDDNKPVLLTNFLLACGELGMDVRAHNTRVTLTDIWCDLHGRGLSRMIERACDELLDI